MGFTSPRRCPRPALVGTAPAVANGGSSACIGWGSTRAVDLLAVLGLPSNRTVRSAGGDQQRTMLLDFHCRSNGAWNLRQRPRRFIATDQVPSLPVCCKAFNYEVSHVMTEAVGRGNASHPWHHEIILRPTPIIPFYDTILGYPVLRIRCPVRIRVSILRPWHRCDVIKFIMPNSA